nr:hypothetical protein GCM10025699_77540 [Microbacterium flavescens]
MFFDIDGTLVDSNYAHVDAWSRAFVEVGHPVDSWRIHRSIGKDSSLLIAGLLGEDVPDDLVERAKEAHTRFYDEHLGDDGDLHVLAREPTCSPSSPVAGTRGAGDERARERAGGAPWPARRRGRLWAVTSSEDVETAKPDPHRRGGPREGRRPGGTGGHGRRRRVRRHGGAPRGRPLHRRAERRLSRDELLEAGAEEVYDDVAALLDALDTSLIGRLGRE